jgi:hypothetical protein
MKIAVINFSGNVGKTTVARHLLRPRINGAGLIAIESINAEPGQASSLRGKQFGDLLADLQTVDSAVVDIGASNVEDLLSLMGKYRDSHEEFDGFVVPTVAALKQQKDTMATLLELSRLGIPGAKVEVLFNMVEDHVELGRTFEPLLGFIEQHPVARASVACRLSANEVYSRVREAGDAGELRSLATDATDFKDLIVRAGTMAEKLELAQRLATRRLARGVLPELDACFAALELDQGAP